MIKQLELFDNIPPSSAPASKKLERISKAREEEVKKTQEHLKQDRERHNEEYCLNYLRTAHYLWDMRAWHKFKDREEVSKYVNSPTHKNDGHAFYCIERLKELGVSKDKIITAIIENNLVQYKNRLVPCFLEDTCPRFKKAGNYVEAGCNQCG